MPIPNFGATFQPGLEQNGMGPSRTANPRQSPVQEAIQVLSLRLPKFYGAQSIAPAPLLNAPGGMGQPAARGNVVAQALAMMAGLPPGMAMPQASAPVLAGSSPTGDWMRQERNLMPRFIPSPGTNITANDPVGNPWDTPPPQYGGPPPYQPPPPNIIPGQQVPTPTYPDPEPYADSPFQWESQIPLARKRAYLGGDY